MNWKLPTLLVLLGLCGCATFDAAGEITFLADAKSNYEAGLAALKAGKQLDAIKYFDHVRYKYPYSSQAALADLGIGDANYEHEKYLEAIEAYRNFLKLHPNHAQVDYAQFRIAVSYYKDISSDFFLFPPSAEKDQTSVRDSKNAFEEFLKLYPNSSFVGEAKTQLADVMTRLSKHEMAVADYYLDHDHPAAAVGRLSKVVHDYPQSELAPEALMKLAKTFVKLDQKDKAREALQKFLKDYATDSHRSEAERLLKSLG